MALTKSDFERLRAVAARFDTKNHVQYLAEALQCLRATEDPVDVLALLRALWGSSHAPRAEQKAALNDVGKWLEIHLRESPKQSAEDLALQLGWLRRMSIFVEAEAKAAGHSKQRRNGHRESQTGAPAKKKELKLEFGTHIDSIRRRRSDAAQTPATSQRRPAAPPPPTVLPTTFPVRFANFLTARDANKQAKERAKRGKPAKDTWLELVPIDDQLAALAIGLGCSMMRTDGMPDLFLRIEQNNNSPVPFWAADIDAQDGRKLVRRILFSASASPAHQAEAGT